MRWNRDELPCAAQHLTCRGEMKTRRGRKGRRRDTQSVSRTRTHIQVNVNGHSAVVAPRYTAHPSPSAAIHKVPKGTLTPKHHFATALDSSVHSLVTENGGSPALVVTPSAAHRLGGVDWLPPGFQLCNRAPCWRSCRCRAHQS